MSNARKVTPEMAAEMQRLRDEGMTLQQIAEKYGLNMVTVGSYTKPPETRKCKLSIRPGFSSEWDEARMRVLGR